MKNKYQVIAINDFNHNGNVSERVIRTFDNIKDAENFFILISQTMKSYRKETRYSLR